MSPALAGGLFTTKPSGKPPNFTFLTLNIALKTLGYTEHAVHTVNSIMEKIASFLYKVCISVYPTARVSYIYQQIDITHK